MARLTEAIRPDTTLVLVGDPGQLRSIEAGAVLGDIVGRAADKPTITARTRAGLEHATGHHIGADQPPPGATIADAITVLDRVHRFDGGIAALATLIRAGDPDAVISLLRKAPPDVTWIPVDVANPPSQNALAPVRDRALAAARSVLDTARAGNARDAIAGLAAFRILCAHRHGPHGMAV